MRYVVLSYQADGTVNVWGTASGHPFASHDAAKDGVGRLKILSDNPEAEVYIAPLERIENLR